MAKFVKGREEVISGIHSSMRFWQSLGRDAFVPQYQRPMIDHLDSVVKERRKPIASEIGVYASFWPRSEGANQVNTLEAELHFEPFVGYEAYNNHYCGPQGEKPREEFNPIS